MISTTKKNFMTQYKSGHLELVTAGIGNKVDVLAKLYAIPTTELTTRGVTRPSIDGSQYTIELFNNKDGAIFYIVNDDGSANTYPYANNNVHLTVYVRI